MREWWDDGVDMGTVESVRIYVSELKKLEAVMQIETILLEQELKKAISEKPIPVMDIKNIQPPKNPYPTSVFPEPSQKQWACLGEYLKRAGLNLDLFSASLARRTWENCCLEWEKLLKRKFEQENENGKK